MLLPVRRLVCACAAVAIALVVCPARADDAESVKKRLAEAKKVYTDAVETFRKAVTDHLAKREEDARKAGNRKLVDQAKAERTAFEVGDEVPANCPPALLTQMKTARADLDAAFAAAVKGYLLLKDDTAAEATEKEQQQFQVASALLFGKRVYLVALKHNALKDEKNWFTDNGALAGPGGAKIKRDGLPVPHSVHTYPPNKGTAEVSYLLAGKWTALSTSVGVPKIEDNAEPPVSPLTFEVVGDGKSLWKSEPVTKLDTFQACRLNVTKVKTLTLRVHCPQENHWARAVWFEPILAE
jgi:hypothetical protein